MKANSFEELLVWQKARNLTKEVYRTTQELPCSRDFRFVAQITSASVSIMSNIAEGFERRTKSEFHQAIVQAKGSAGELRSQLYVALDAGYLDQVRFDTLMLQVIEVSRLLEGLRASLDQQRRSKP